MRRKDLRHHNAEKERSRGTPGACLIFSIGARFLQIPFLRLLSRVLISCEMISPKDKAPHAPTAPPPFQRWMPPSGKRLQDKDLISVRGTMSRCDSGLGALFLSCSMRPGTGSTPELCCLLVCKSPEHLV